MVESTGMHIGNRIVMISPRPMSSEDEDCNLEVSYVITLAFEMFHPLLPIDSKGTSATSFTSNTICIADLGSQKSPGSL
jgi:hypothetical protein